MAVSFTGCQQPEVAMAPFADAGRQCSLAVRRGNSKMSTNAGIAASALVLSMAAMVLCAPTAHGGDVLTTVSPVSSEGTCPLRRLGDQLVRCDDLTGAGVAAPTWTPPL